MSLTTGGGRLDGLLQTLWRNTGFLGPLEELTVLANIDPVAIGLPIFVLSSVI